MAELCPFSSERFGYAVAGFGPAGCGFLLHAIKTNRIEHLIEEGLVVIERAAAPGPGKVGRYQLTGNSLSRAFLDCVDDPGIAFLFDDLLKTEPSIKRLRELELDAPPLDVVGDFLTAMARRTMEYLIKEHGIPVLVSTEIDHIQQNGDGHYTLSLRDLCADQSYTISADNLICALGGRQAMDVVRATEMVPGLRLGDATGHLMVSDDFLMMPDEAVRAAIPLSEGSADIVVVGGSHSAISTVDRLCQALAPAGLKRLTMLHQSSLRLYYASPEEAREDGYPFQDPEDICPMSGRVNRFGGLRYRSLDVAKSILKTGRMPDHDVEINWMPLKSTDPAAVTAALGQAPAVIACMGYQANLPPMVNERGETIHLKNRPRGVEVDEIGRVMGVGRGPIPGLYAIGIGSTLLKRSDAIGGERSFRGSADGVWLYHNHGGAVILDALPGRQSKERFHHVSTEQVANNAHL